MPVLVVPYFKNPRMAAESTTARPSSSLHPTPPKSTLNSHYWPAFPSSFQIPTLERVHASVLASHPHPPVKVVKHDWGIRSTSTSTNSEPSLKVTWVGYAVRPQVAPSTCSLIPLLACIQSFIVEFPRVAAGPLAQDEPARVLFDPIFSECAGPSPWVGIRRRLPPCTVAEPPDFQFIVYSHGQCVLSENRPSVAQ